MTDTISTPSIHPKVRDLPALTSLRFLAAIFVVVYHYFGQNELMFGHSLFALGYTGVSFFFLLSGFILAYNYNRVDFTESGRITSFLKARAARIYPLYLVSLLMGLGPFIFAIKGRMDPLLHQLYLSDLVLAPLSLQAWVPGAASAINYPSWSISTEWFFYCCFPLVLRWIIASPRLWLALTAGYWLTVNIFVYALWQMKGPQGAPVNTLAFNSDTSILMAAEFIKFFPVLRLPEFVIGILAYVYWSRREEHLNVAYLLICSAVSLIALVRFSGWLPSTLIHTGLSAFVWLPLILAGTRISSPILTSGFSVFLGKISFALYLFHALSLQYIVALAKRWPLPFLTQEGLIIPALILSFALAIAGHLYIEEPLRRRITNRLSRK